MQQFTVNPRSSVNGASCDTCCCEPAVITPGEINKWMINYAPWSAPIGGKGLTSRTTFEIEKKTTATPGGDQPPVTTFAGVATDFNTAFVGDLTTYVTDPEAGDLEFSAVPMYGPKNGTLVIALDGTVTYTPMTGFTGYDSFFYQVTDGTYTRLGEINVAVSPADPAPVLAPKTVGTPAIRIRREALSVPRDQHFITFPLEVSPAAIPGDVYRLTIRQEALDCDCNPFYHVSCYDLSVGNC